MGANWGKYRLFRGFIPKAENTGRLGRCDTREREVIGKIFGPVEDAHSVIVSDVGICARPEQISDRIYMSAFDSELGKTEGQQRSRLGQAGNLRNGPVRESSHCTLRDLPQSPPRHRDAAGSSRHRRCDKRSGKVS